MQLDNRFRKWFGSGQPDYFLDGFDSIYYKRLEVPVDNETYILNKVKIIGTGNIYTTDIK